MIAVLVPIVLVGAIAHGALAFGFPLISTPLIAFFIDIKTAVLITVVAERGSLPLLSASLPLTVLAMAAPLLGIRLQQRLSPRIDSKLLRATLAAFVVLLTAQAAIELADRLHFA